MMYASSNVVSILDLYGSCRPQYYCIRILFAMKECVWESRSK